MEMIKKYILCEKSLMTLVCVFLTVATPVRSFAWYSSEAVSGSLPPDSCALPDSQNEPVNKLKEKKLGRLLKEIDRNYNSYASSWKNLPLAHEAFDLMRDGLPLRAEGGITPYTRIVMLDKMVDCLPERDCARLILAVREYQMSMFPLISDGDIAEDMKIDEYEGDPARYARSVTEDDIRKSLKRTEDFLNPRISMERWCREYGIRLKFDPVEMSEEWENVIYDVERECDEILQDEVKGMGFCYKYWSTKKEALARRGIDWSSPSTMNPRVIFD